MTRKKVKLLSDHDAKEVAMFMQFLRDKETMPPAKLYRKYQEYCGLSDVEIAKLEGK